MRIAAVITTYNSATSIERAVLSVFAQSRAPDSVLIIDDGSSDDTLRLAAAFPGIRLIARENGGAAAARNTGLFAADAEWVAFLDGDDEWLPNKLSVYERAAKRHPHAGLLFAPVWLHEGANVTRGGDWEGSLPVAELLRGCRIPTASSIFVNAKAAISAGGFCAAYRTGEDWEFYLRMARQFPILGLGDEPLTRYYLTPGGLHNRFVGARVQATRFLLRESGLAFLRSGLGCLPAVRRGLGAHFQSFAYYASRERKTVLTAMSGIAALGLTPVSGAYPAGRSLLRAFTGW